MRDQSFAVAVGIVVLIGVVTSTCGGGDDAVRDGPFPDLCVAAGVEDPNPSIPTQPAQEPTQETVESEWPHRPVLIVDAVVMTAAGDIFDTGYVLFENGRITALGPGRIEPPSEDTWLIEADGRYVTPGLIDPHSHMGVYPQPGVAALSDGNEVTSPVTAHIQAIDSIWPQDPGFERAVAGGVTTVQILPGSANLIGGRSVTLKLHSGALIAQDMRFPGAPDGLKMACGENPKMVYGGRDQTPSTRMASIALMREAYIGAASYLEQQQDYDEEVRLWCEDGAPDDGEPNEPNRNLGRETLAAVLEGEILVHVHCYRADEMLLQIQIADELGYEIRSFEHAVEAYKIRDVLAERDIGVSTWADWWGFKMEAYDAIIENAGLVTMAGGRVLIQSDSSIVIQRLNQEAGKAFYQALDSGLELTEDDAIRWITINSAWSLGVDEQTGSLEVGKMADVVIWSGHPFSVYTRADLVFIDGILEYDRANAGDPWSDFEVGLRPQEQGE